MGWHAIKETHKGTQGRHVALYMGDEGGFLGDEGWYTKVVCGFKLYFCIGFSSNNKERVSLRGHRLNSRVEPC